MSIQTGARTQFMSGCAAILRGAWEAGVDVVSSYPGSPVTEIVHLAEKNADMQSQWAVNEKVALEVACGVSHGGGRVLAVMKHVGLNVASDPLFNVAYTGVKGGLVIVVGDDPGAASSQNEQDTRMVAMAANVPVLEPSNIQDAYVMTKLAFEISETFDLPVIVRVTSEHCYGSSNVVVGSRAQDKKRELGFAKPIQKYLLIPDFVVGRHAALKDNLNDFAVSKWSSWFVDRSQMPLEEGKKYSLGIVCSGTAHLLIQEVIQDLNIPVLKLGVAFPINKNAVFEFAQHCEKLLVIEESSTVVENQVRLLGLPVLKRKNFTGVGKLSYADLVCEGSDMWNSLIQQRQEKKQAKKSRVAISIPVEVASQAKTEIKAKGNLEHLSVPKRPAGFCAGCSHSPIFHLLGKREIYVVGDIGCYTLGATEPFSSLHANLCMGASIGILQGYLSVMDDEARKQAVAVIGDSTFFHSGITPLLTSINQGMKGTILLLDNSRSAMTGYQATYPSKTKEQWLKLLDGLGVPDFSVVDALNVAEITQQFDQHMESDQLSVMVLKGDCVQGRTTKGPTNFRYTINEDLCTSCGKCLETDCPSIVKSPLDLTNISITNECIGCGFCSQVCPENAILPLSVNFESKTLSKVSSKVPWHRVINLLRSTPVVKDLLHKFEYERY